MTITSAISRIPEPILWLISVLIALLSFFLVSYFIKKQSEKDHKKDYLWIIGGITFGIGIFGSIYTLIKIILNNMPFSIILLIG